MISPSSPESIVMEYFETRCEKLVQTYGRTVFQGVDGEVFFGLTPATIDMVFPNFETRDKGLLLAKIETARNCFVQQHPPQSEYRDVTPPPTFRRSPEKKSLDEVQTVIHSPCKTPVTAIHSPARRLIHPVCPLVPGTALPRMLVELWRADEEEDFFVAETWLPDFQLQLAGPVTHRLSMRRTVHVKGFDEGTSVPTLSQRAARKWYASLIVTVRLDRIGNEAELFFSEIRELSFDQGKYFLKIYTYTDILSLVFTSDPQVSGDSSSNATVVFDQRLVLSFTKTGIENEEKTVEKNDRGRSTSISRQSRSRSTTPIGVSVELLKKIMKAGDRRGEVGESVPSSLASQTSLFDLLLLASKNELYRLNPRYMRVEAYLLPTHETSAHFGPEWTLRSRTQIEALRTDTEYMMCHSQVIELFLLAWTHSWTGQSWLLRHALLSCILLRNTDMAKKVIQFAKNNRLADLTETGFGEALFSLQNDQKDAQIFWDAPPGPPVLKSMYNDAPATRNSLASLIAFAKNDQ